LDVILRCEELPHRGTIGNGFEHLLAHAIRHFSLEKIFFNYVFLDERFFERTNGGVSSDALLNRQNSIGWRVIGLSHGVVGRPTPAECHNNNCCSSNAEEMSDDVQPHPTKPLLFRFSCASLKQRAMNSQ